MSLDLYSLLPVVMRIKSEMSPTTENPEGLLKDICYALEQETETTLGQIQGLSDLILPTECPQAFLPLIAKLLGIHMGPAWSDEQREHFVLAAGSLWKIKCLRQSWKYILEQYGYTDYFPWELWKTKIYEEYDYSLYQDYQHRFKAARVDIRRPIDTTGNHGLYLDDLIESVRPAHVLIRRPGRTANETTETIVAPEDALSAGAYRSPINEAGPAFGETFVQDYTCTLTGCEAVCQTGCTAACELSCQFGPCEVASCQGWCMLNCELFCEYQCQTGCEDTCENDLCQVTACQLGCQIACQVGIE